MNDTPTPETQFQVLQNGDGRFRSALEELVKSRSIEIVQSCRILIREKVAREKELAEAREQRDTLREALIDCCVDSETLLTYQEKEGFHYVLPITKAKIQKAKEALAATEPPPEKYSKITDALVESMESAMKDVKPYDAKDHESQYP